MNTAIPTGIFVHSCAWRIARKPWVCRSRQWLKKKPQGHTQSIAVSARHLELMFENVPWSRNTDRLCEACANAALGEEAMNVMFGTAARTWQKPSEAAPDWYPWEWSKAMDDRFYAAIRERNARRTTHA